MLSIQRREFQLKRHRLVIKCVLYMWALSFELRKIRLHCCVVAWHACRWLHEFDFNPFTSETWGCNVYRLHPQAASLLTNLCSRLVGISNESLCRYRVLKVWLLKAFGIHSRTLSKPHTINGPDQLWVVAFTGFLWSIICYSIKGSTAHVVAMAEGITMQSALL